uniref:Proliferating cell nuclear antigen PCNA N-terminal domain-containing protein n=1 Tax=viral metagenome TaxID=1070528 RepID=A0A6C0I0G7_9ZZZZ
MDIYLSNPIKAEQFTGIFQHIKLFTDQICIIFEKTGIYVQTMDNTRVSIFELNIPSTWFDRYSHTEDGAITIGISSSLLFKILNTRDKIQYIKFEYDPKIDDKLAIRFLCEAIDARKLAKTDTLCVFDKHFEIPLIDITEDHVTIPEIDFQAEILLPSSIFASIIQQLKLFGESLDIKCNEENILLCANSVENGKMFVEINIDDINEFSINEGETIELSYSLNYLNNICLYHKLSKNIEIKLCDQYPMRIQYDLGDGANILFYLAPKIKDDE